MTGAMIQASCHCGAVTLAIGATPTEVTECNCSICRKYGVLWAYYRRADVRVSEPTQSYAWGNRTLLFHRCVECGCVTHWSAVDPDRDKIGVNARLMPRAVLADAAIRILDRADPDIQGPD